MRHSLLYNLNAFYIVSGLLIAMIGTLALGYRLGLRKTDRESDYSTMISSLLGLLGLLLAFTFGMSGSRYESRRQSMVEESNCIGTAMLRMDLYPDSIRKTLQAGFELYIDARIAYYESGRDKAKFEASEKLFAKASAGLWKKAADVARSKDYYSPSNMFIPALNNMFDSAASVNALNKTTVPESILYLLFLFSVLSTFFIGYISGMKQMYNKLLVYGFCILTCMVVYIILDLDRPSRGLINLETEVNMIRELKAQM